MIVYKGGHIGSYNVSYSYLVVANNIITIIRICVIAVEEYKR